jgi:hypothetical protein
MLRGVPMNIGLGSLSLSSSLLGSCWARDEAKPCPLTALDASKMKIRRDVFNKAFGFIARFLLNQ